MICRVLHLQDHQLQGKAKIRSSFFYYNPVDKTEFVFYFCSKSSAVVIDNNILDDIQVIEPEIQSSDQELYQVSQSQVFFFVCLLRRYSSLLWISVAT